MLASLVNPASLGWSIGASLVQTIFDGGALQAGSDLAKAQQAEQLADYRNAVFSAFSDVETALGSVASAEDQLSSAIQEDQAAAEAFRISDVQYRAGTIDILSVLQSQQLLFQADNTLIQSKLQRLQADVALYQALAAAGPNPITTRSWPNADLRDHPVKIALGIMAWMPLTPSTFWVTSKSTPTEARA